MSDPYSEDIDDEKPFESNLSTSTNELLNSSTSTTTPTQSAPIISPSNNPLTLPNNNNELAMQLLYQQLSNTMTDPSRLNQLQQFFIENTLKGDTMTSTEKGPCSCGFRHFWKGNIKDFIIRYPVNMQTFVLFACNYEDNPYEVAETVINDNKNKLSYMDHKYRLAHYISEVMKAHCEKSGYIYPPPQKMREISAEEKSKVKTDQELAEFYKDLRTRIGHLKHKQKKDVIKMGQEQKEKIHRETMEIHQKKWIERKNKDKIEVESHLQKNPPNLSSLSEETPDNPSLDIITSSSQPVTSQSQSIAPNLLDDNTDILLEPSNQTLQPTEKEKDEPTIFSPESQPFSKQLNPKIDMCSGHFDNNRKTSKILNGRLVWSNEPLWVPCVRATLCTRCAEHITTSNDWGDKKVAEKKVHGFDDINSLNSADSLPSLPLSLQNNTTNSFTTHVLSDRECSDCLIMIQTIGLEKTQEFLLQKGKSPELVRMLPIILQSYSLRSMSSTDDATIMTAPPPTAPFPKQPYTFPKSGGKILSKQPKLSTPSSTDSTPAPQPISDPQSLISLDSNLPHTSLRFRLSNNKTITVQFNLTNTILDIRNFLDQYCPLPSDTSYKLLVGRPPKELTDLNSTLEALNLKNCVIQQSIK